MNPVSIYIHIPFCLRRCPYCDFNTYALTSIPEKEYVSALLSELDFRASQEAWKERTVETVYFGGGTPTLFKPSSIKQITEAISVLFHLSPDAEICMEANPGTIDPDNLNGYRAAGINRISIGAQSFDSDLLRVLGRIHSSEDIVNGVTAAKDAGFDNIGIDLMYGIPNETLEQLQNDLRQAIHLDPKHISVYGLTLEKGTPFYQRFKKGDLEIPNEDTIMAMMSEVNVFLPSCGYKRYEISNYAERGYEAKHNLVYWDGGDYLGIGAGAHSLLVNYQEVQKISAIRWSNHALPNKYIKLAVAHGQAQNWHEELSQKELMFEFFFLGLRKIDGVFNRDFEKHFNYSISGLYGATIEILNDQNLISWNGENLKLTNRGLQLADSVIENFVCPL